MDDSGHATSHGNGYTAVAESASLAHTKDQPLRDLSQVDAKNNTTTTTALTDTINGMHDDAHADSLHMAPGTTFRLYKIRWFGLTMVMLANFLVSYHWVIFTAVAPQSAQYYNVSLDAISWSSNSELCGYVLAGLSNAWVLHRFGVQFGIRFASVVMFLACWLRYFSVFVHDDVVGRYALVIVGQTLVGVSQAYALNMASKFSALWFDERGRTTSTMMISIAGPFGAAIGQLVTSSVIVDASQIPIYLLILAIITTVLCILMLFIPREPPTPPSYSASVPYTPYLEGLAVCLKNMDFWVIFILFSVFVAIFNAFTTVINQVLNPYGYDNTEAAIVGAIFIVAGLVAAAISSPLMDKYHVHITTTRIVVPLLSVTYIGFYFCFGPNRLAVLCVVSAIVGALSFIVLPISIELAAEATFPIAPETSNALLWTGGNTLGVILIVLFGVLRDDPNHPTGGEPPGSLHRGLILQTVLAAVIFPIFFLYRGKTRRIDLDKQARFESVV